MHIKEDLTRRICALININLIHQSYKNRSAMAKESVKKRKVSGYILMTLLLVLMTATSGDDTRINRDEARKAFVYLNQVRENPQKYYKELGYSKNIRVSDKSLRWNDTLAVVAEAKAYDMAKRDYFSHVDPEGFGINHYISLRGYKLNNDWLKNKSDNYFESLAAGSRDGEDAIRQLIIDEDDAKGGYRHRIHLLGLDEWSSSLTDIGIGFAVRPDSEYQTYICVIIAKHDW